MVVFPSIQRKAQTELDEVVGRGQLPRFADSARLPYIHAIVKETLRWRPVVPMALPHRVTEDDRYGGYHIPKGAICIPNVWQVSRMSYSVKGSNDTM
jgi:cytochrome P450